MTCDEVRASLEAFIAGDLSKREGADVVDHLGSCPSCSLEYEELSQLVSDLRHSRAAIRPFRSFDVTALPSARRPRRTRLLLAASIVLGVWAVIATCALLWTSLETTNGFMGILRSDSTTVATPSSNLGSPSALSLANVPTPALVAVLESVSSGSPHALASPNRLRSGLLPGGDVTMRVTRLGPVVRNSSSLVIVRAMIGDVSAGNLTSQQTEVQMTISKDNDGHWTVTRVVKAP